MLRAVVLPPGARAVSGFSGAPDAVGSSLLDAQRVALVERYLVAGRSPVEIEAFLARRVPAGLKAFEHGVAGNRTGPTGWSLGFEPTSLPATVSQALLAFSMTPAPFGGTRLRIDAQVLWQLPHPADLAVGRDVASARLARFVPGSTPPAQQVRLGAGAALQAIVLRFDALPVAGPGLTSCPNDYGVRIRLSLPATRTQAPIVATLDNCGFVATTVGGRAGPTLRDAVGPSFGGLGDLAAASLGFKGYAVWRISGS